MKKYSYVSLICRNDYMPALVAMLDSFNQIKSKYQMTILVDKSISFENREIIRFFGASVLEVEQLIPDGFTILETDVFNSETNSYPNTDARPASSRVLLKLNIFGLTQFDKVVYLDADMLFVKNTDELFDWPSGSAVVDEGWAYVNKVDPQFNAGLIVVEPSVKLFNIIKNEVMSYSGKTNWEDILGRNEEILDDQIIIYNTIGKNWPHQDELHLPKFYNLQIAFYNFSAVSLDELRKVKLLHISHGIRPWAKSWDEVRESCYNRMYLSGAVIYFCWMHQINRVIDYLSYAGYQSKDLVKCYIPEYF